MTRIACPGSGNTVSQPLKAKRRADVAEAADDPTTNESHLNSP